MTGEMTFDELLTAIEHAWINDSNMIANKPWESAVMVTTFAQAASRRQCFVFEGVVAIPVRLNRKNSLLDWDTFEQFRWLSRGPNDETLHGLIIRYDAISQKFDHECIWDADSKFDLFKTGYSKALFDSLRPVVNSEHFKPVQERGARILVSESEARRVAGVSVRDGEARAERIRGGWRVYTPLDPEQPRPLPSMDDALEHTVYLVTDTGDVTYTTAPVDEHERLLAELD